MNKPKEQWYFYWQSIWNLLLTGMKGCYMKCLRHHLSVLSNVVIISALRITRLALLQKSTV